MPIPIQNTGFIASLHWDLKTLSLYFIDFYAKGDKPAIFRHDYRTGIVYSAQIIGQESPSFIKPVDGCNGEFLVGLGGYVMVIQWDGVSGTAQPLRILFTVPQVHMNFALIDPKGRLFAGTLDNRLFCAVAANNTMYRFSKRKGLTPIFDTIRTTNGLVINKEQNKFYHADGCLNAIVEFDYDPKTGDLCKHFHLCKTDD